MPLFINENDVNYWKTVNKETYKLFFKPIKIYKRKKIEFQSIYGEDPNPQFELPYEIEAYIPTLTEWKNMATRYGLDEVRDFRIFFSPDVLKEAGVVIPEIGDHIELQNDTYKVTQVNPTDYNSNLQIPLSFVVDVKRIHFEKPDQATTVFVEY